MTRSRWEITRKEDDEEDEGGEFAVFIVTDLSMRRRFSVAVERATLESYCRMCESSECVHVEATLAHISRES